MLETCAFDCVLSGITEKTTNSGASFTVARLKHECEQFGKMVTTEIEVTVPASMKESLPAENSKVNAVCVITSRDYNGRPFYNFRLKSVKAIEVVEPEAITEEAIDSALDEIPF